MRRILPELTRSTLAVIASLTVSSAVMAQMAPPGMPPATAPATTAPAATEPVEAPAVKAGLEAYNKAVDDGDVKAMIASVHVSSDLQKKALDEMGKLTTAGRELYDASVKTYGADELAKDNVAKQSFPGGFPALSSEGLSVKVTGDKATLASASPDGPPALSMVKKESGWKIDGDALLPPMGAKELADQTVIIEGVVSAIADVTADVKAGKFRGADEALAIMNLRVQKAVHAAREKMAPMEMPAPTTIPVGPDAPTMPPTPMQ